MCQKAGIVCIPSFQEGPHSTLNEDEFFDALEMAYQIGESEHVSYFGLYNGLPSFLFTAWVYMESIVC